MHPQGAARGSSREDPAGTGAGLSWRGRPSRGSRARDPWPRNGGDDQGCVQTQQREQRRQGTGCRPQTTDTSAYKGRWLIPRRRDKQGPVSALPATPAGGSWAAESHTGQSRGPSRPQSPLAAAPGTPSPSGVQRCQPDPTRPVDSRTVPARSPAGSAGSMSADHSVLQGQAAAAGRGRPRLLFHGFICIESVFWVWLYGISMM